MQVDEFIDKTETELEAMYREAASIHGQTTLTGEFKKTNKVANLIDKIYKEMKFRKVAEKSLTKLIFDENISVKIWAATHLLPFRPEQAEKELEKINAKENSILGFGARTVLQQWRKGELSF